MEEQRILRFRVWDYRAKQYCLQSHMMNIHTGWISDSTTRYLVEQFIGLKDKNNVDIYENDILMMDSWKPKYYVVKFLEGAFCLTFLSGELKGEFAGDIHYIQHAGHSQATVVGNIHEFKQEETV